MSLYLNLVGRAVEVIGATALALTGRAADHKPAYGAAPSIPQARTRSIPTLKMPTARGWRAGEKPVAAPGLKVNPFAMRTKHARQLLVLPNGDVLVAEACTEAGPPGSLFDVAIMGTMTRAGALQKSSNTVSLLRDADGDGVAEVRETILGGLSQPYGLAWIDGTLYVGNTDGLMAFPYQLGETRITAPGRKLMDLVGRTGHWTRNLFPNADNTKLYVAVGSLSNIGDAGMDAEVNRACIHEYDIASGKSRVFASGLRNPVGMAREPSTGMLWTVVNERDGIGDETPPDYLTSVQDGAFYGWPYCYWNRIVDDRVPQDAAMVAKALQPDFALGGHTASLGLCWAPEGTLPGYPAGMIVGQHGSWNRSRLSGYKVVLVPFANGKPTGAPPMEILTGFLGPDERFSYGRPVGVGIAGDGSVLVVDDVGNAVWRVTGA